MLICRFVVRLFLRPWYRSGARFDLAGCRLRNSLSWRRFCKGPRRIPSRWIPMKLLCWLNPFMFQRLPARDERQMVGSYLVSSPWSCSRRGCSRAKGSGPQPLFDVKLPRAQRNCGWCPPASGWLELWRLEARSGCRGKSGGLALQRLGLSYALSLGTLEEWLM